MKPAIALALVSLLVAQPLIADGAERKRQKIESMRVEVLKDLHDLAPHVVDEIDRSVGFGVFSNLGVNLVLLSAGAGSGVVRDNRTGDDTYMRMASAGLGVGLGVKDFRGVFVFHTRAALDRFLDHGWDFSGQADAAAKAGDKGAEKSLSDSAVDGVSLYQLTETGLALQATLQGTKYWKNKRLN